MKKLIAAALLMAGVAVAQNTLMRVDIPFQFVVGEMTLPAGSYLVKADSESRHVELLGPDVRIAIIPYALSVFRSEAGCERGQLEFHSYGNVRILRNVWTAGQWRGFSLPAPRAEKELVRIVIKANS